MDTIQVEFDEYNKPDDHLVKYVDLLESHDSSAVWCGEKLFSSNSSTFRTGGIPARTADGERLLLYVGIIDILQSYQIRKKLEHTLKSVLTDGVRFDFCSMLCDHVALI